MISRRARDRSPRIRVLLLAPVAGNISPSGETPAPAAERGAGGLLLQSTLLIAECRRQGLVELGFVDTAVRWRRETDRRLTRRLLGGFLHGVRTILRLAEALVFRRPHCLQVRSTGGLGLVRDCLALAMAALVRVRPCVSFHFGRIPQLALSKGREWTLVRLACALSDRVVVLDRASEAVLRSAGTTRVTVIPNGVDLAWIDAILAENAPLPEHGIVRLVCSGWVLPHKGVDDLLAACSRLRGLDFEVELVGPVEERRRVELSGIPWLRVMGHLPPREAVARVARAHVLVMPSHAEGCPNTILEAQACGKPVIGTAVGAVPEILTPHAGDVSGICVPPRDVARLADAIAELAKSASGRERMGRVGRRRVEERYQIADVATAYARLWTATSGR